MKKSALILLVLFALILSSCAPAMQSASDMTVSEGMSASEADYGNMEMSPPQSEFPRTISADAVAVERIVIKNANLSIVVADPAQAMDTIVKMAEDLGGFVVNSYLYKTYTDTGLEVPAAEVTVRVPADSLTSSLDKIKALVSDPSKDILNETVTGEDVTREYTDLKSRLRNQENAAEQLQKIMDEAYKTEEVLQVYNELVRVQEEIEILKGQIKYYDEASRLSAVTVSIQAQEAIEPLSIGQWQPQGIARDALQALINALKFIGSALIWIIIFIIPVLAILFIPIWLVIRFFIRRSKKQKAKQPVQENHQPEE